MTQEGGTVVTGSIERYLDEPNVERPAREFKYLLSAVKSYHGELELAFRKGRLSVYYRGNSPATIVFRHADTYRIEIHERFLAGLDKGTRAKFSVSRGYGRVEVDAHDAHQVLRRPNIDKLMKAIRDVNHSEELTFEQILITDNPPTPGFLLIDRHSHPCSRPSPHPPRQARALSAA